MAFRFWRGTPVCRAFVDQMLSFWRLSVYCELHLVREQYSLLPATCGLQLELAASIEPFALVLILQELDFVEPVVLASEFLSHYLMHWRETDIDMACDFSHGDSRISVIFQILTVFSMQPWTINVMAKLPESMNYCGCR